MQHLSKRDVFITNKRETKKSINRLKEAQTEKAMTVKLNANEVVLKAGDTKQVIENSTIEGKLIVTNQRLYFKTMDQNTDRFNLEILFDNILEVIYYSKGLFMVKGLNIVTKDGKCHNFPLKKRDEIGQLINKMY